MQWEACHLPLPKLGLCLRGPFGQGFPIITPITIETPNTAGSHATRSSSAIIPLPATYAVDNLGAQNIYTVDIKLITIVF